MKTDKVRDLIHNLLPQFHCIAVVCLLFAVHAQAEAPWFDSAWPHRRQVTVSGTLATETLTNFPVLVQFLDQSSSLFRKSQITGEDIVFTAADGITQLAHDIDSYNAWGSKALNAWVRLPELSSTTDTVLYMYYGNPTAADQQDKATVWAEYAGVWHLEEDKPGVNTTSEIYKDSTGNGYHGKDYVSTNSAAGRIGSGANLDGNDYIWFAKTLSTTNAFTITAWAKPEQLDKEVVVGGGSWYFNLQDADRLLGHSRTSSTTYGATYGYGADLKTGQWQHVVFHSTGEEGALRSFFKNGVQLSSSTSPVLNPPLTDLWAYIGRFSDSYFHGILDEVRISDKALPPAWLTAEYRNTDSPSSYVTFGPEEGGTSVVSWRDSCFTYRQEIALWPGVTEAELTNFPMLVAITNQGNNVFSIAADNGADIMFTAADGVTQLAHEIEEYSAASLYAWVKLPILHTAAPTYIYMYYGCNSYDGFQDKTGVWSEGYLGVWHLGETVSNGQTNYDSTASAAHGVFQDLSARGGGDASGKIAGANAFHGFDDHYVKTPGVQCSTNGFTISAWVNSVNPSPNRQFECSSRGTSYFRIGGNKSLVAVNTPDGPSFNYLTAQSENSAIQADTWHHLAAVCAPPRVIIYLDGSFSGQSAVFTNMNAQPRANYIGRYVNTNSPFNGRVDELRVSSILRTPEWIKACYVSQNGPGGNLLFGPPEFRAPTGSLIILR